MFEKFGQMDYRELNNTAQGLKEEGDIESLMLLATENGLDEDDAEDFMYGNTDTFTSLIEAAMGRLKVERESLGLSESVTLMGMSIVIMQVVLSEEKFQENVFKKSLAGCLGKMIREASRTQRRLPGEIAKEAGIGECYMGDLTNEQVRELAARYYGGVS